MNFFKKIIAYHQKKNYIDCSQQDFRVTLKPILEISPNIYITTLFVMALCLVLFFLLLFPGIKNNGTLLTITSTPSYCALFINDQYRAQTPCKVFLKKGNYKLAISYDGGESQSLQYKVSGRLFGSLFFPKQKTLNLTATTIDPKNCAHHALQQFLHLTSYHSFEPSTIPPQIATQTIQKLYAASPSQLQKEVIANFLYTTLISANSPELKADAFSALEFHWEKELQNLNNSKNVDLQELYTNIATTLINYSETHPSLFFDYYIYIPSKFRKEIKQQQAFLTYKEQLITYCSIPPSLDFGKLTGNKMIKDGKEFLQYKGGLVRLNQELAATALKKIADDQRPLQIPLLYKFDDFYISTQAINKSDFDQFLATNTSIEKKWKEENKVNRFYEPQGDKESVRGISYHCATDYLASKGYRLPYLCEIKSLEPQKYQLPKIVSPFSSKENAFQEWCNDSYCGGYFTNLNFLPEGAIFIFDDSKNIITSYPKDFCTVLTGFRAAFSKNDPVVIPLSNTKNGLF